METCHLGNTDLDVSRIVLGTWALGGWLWGGTSRNEPHEAVDAALANGVNCIDTAPAYGFGLSEELVGKAVKGRRGDVLIATKCGLVWDDRPGATPFFDTKDDRGRPLRIRRCLRKASILSECDASLIRLGIDEIDLYQCHWPDPGTPLDETMDALLTLRDRGKIRAFGVSNFSVEQLQACHPAAPLASNQPKYSLLSRQIEADILPYCRENRIGILAYSPMEMGLLTGHISAEHAFPDTDTRRDRPWFQREKRAEVLAALEDIRPIAAAHDATLAQIAIAWVLVQPGVTAAIVGARNGNQAAGNAYAGTISLSAEEEAAIRARFEQLTLDSPEDPERAKR